MHSRRGAASGRRYIVERGTPVSSRCIVSGILWGRSEQGSSRNGRAPSFGSLFAKQRVVYALANEWEFKATRNGPCRIARRRRRPWRRSAAGTKAPDVGAPVAGRGAHALDAGCITLAQHRPAAATAREPVGDGAAAAKVWFNGCDLGRRQHDDGAVAVRTEFAPTDADRSRRRREVGAVALADRTHLGQVARRSRPRARCTRLRQGRSAPRPRSRSRPRPSRACAGAGLSPWAAAPPSATKPCPCLALRTGSAPARGPRCTPSCSTACAAARPRSDGWPCAS